MCYGQSGSFRGLGVPESATTCATTCATTSAVSVGGDSALGCLACVIDPIPILPINIPGLGYFSGIYRASCSSHSSVSLNLTEVMQASKDSRSIHAPGSNKCEATATSTTATATTAVATAANKEAKSAKTVTFAPNIRTFVGSSVSGAVRDPVVDDRRTFVQPSKDSLSSHASGSNKHEAIATLTTATVAAAAATAVNKEAKSAKTVTFTPNVRTFVGSSVSGAVRNSAVVADRHASGRGRGALRATSSVLGFSSADVSVAVRDSVLAKSSASSGASGTGGLLMPGSYTSFSRSSSAIKKESGVARAVRPVMSSYAVPCTYAMSRYGVVTAPYGSSLYAGGVPHFTMAPSYRVMDSRVATTFSGAMSDSSVMPYYCHRSDSCVTFPSRAMPGYHNGHAVAPSSATESSVYYGPDLSAAMVTPYHEPDFYTVPFCSVPEATYHVQEPYSMVYCDAPTSYSFPQVHNVEQTSGEYIFSESGEDEHRSLGVLNSKYESDFLDSKFEFFAYQGFLVRDADVSSMKRLISNSLDVFYVDVASMTFNVETRVVQGVTISPDRCVDLVRSRLSKYSRVFSSRLINLITSTMWSRFNVTYRSNGEKCSDSDKLQLLEDLVESVFEQQNKHIDDLIEAMVIRLGMN